MDDLVTWLREQIAEDRAAVEVGRSPHAHGCDHVECCCDQGATVLAQCDAHEALLALHVINQGACDVCGEWDYDWPCKTLRILALAYQHRPGYREEWRP